MSPKSSSDTVAPRLGSNSTSPSVDSRRSASRSGVRDTPSSSASDAWRSLAPRGRSPDRIALAKRGVDVVDDALDLERAGGRLGAHGLCIHYAVAGRGSSRAVLTAVRPRCECIQSTDPRRVTWLPAPPPPRGGELGERRLGTIHAVAQALAIGPMFSVALVLGGVSRPDIGAGWNAALARADRRPRRARDRLRDVALRPQVTQGAGAVYEYLTHGAHPSVGIFTAGHLLRRHAVPGRRRHLPRPRHPHQRLLGGAHLRPPAAPGLVGAAG